jgi:hypothetical protein
MQPKMLTMDSVIKNRQAELVNEVFEIETKLSQLQQEMERLVILKEQRMMEHQFLESGGFRNEVRITNGMRTTSDRLSFEDCLMQIYDQYGRPLQVKEIISAVERFGYQWSSYQSAWAYITNSGMLEKTGQRGYYNIIRARGW